ncbi:MAG: aldo/keto reductase [Devosia sp.]
MAHKLTDRRQAGQTSLQLPPFGFGSAHLGGMYSRPSGEVARATLQAAWDGGVRFYDTAPYYGLGLSEHRVGNFLMDQPRDEFVLTTKIGRYFKRPADPRTFDRGGWGGGLNMEIVWDYSYDGVMRSYEQSLLRLGLDTIDALFIHDPEPEGHGEHHAARMKDMATTGIKALEELKASGQIKAIGMGMNAAESLVNIAPLVPLDFCIVAMPYTLLDQGSLNTGMQRCLDEGISVVIGAPYASGILATGPIEGARYRYGFADEAILEKTRRIQAVAARHNVSLQAAALQFPLAHPAVVSVIPGGAKPEEVQSNLRYLVEEIPAEFWVELKVEGLIVADAPVPTA